MNLHRTIITVASATLISLAANAEDASLKGTVTDAQGEPLIAQWCTSKAPR